MSRSCTADEVSALFGPAVFFEPRMAEEIRIFSPHGQRYIVFQDLVVPLGDKTRMVLGSDPEECDMVFIGSRIEKQHAEIIYRDGCYFIHDLGSPQGTYVNRRRISGPAELHAGDEIMLMPYRMTFAGAEAGGKPPVWEKTSL